MDKVVSGMGLEGRELEWRQWVSVGSKWGHAFLRGRRKDGG